ncbi:hypothetical protein [Neomoorella thermoacetica]|nr:hypothetical protein [Moorella thermoacetica]
MANCAPKRVRRPSPSSMPAVFSQVAREATCRLPRIEWWRQPRRSDR